MIDSLISFQIENFVKSEKEEGRSEGVSQVKDEIILKMLDDSIDDETIQKCTGCSLEHIHELKLKSGK